MIMLFAALGGCQPNAEEALLEEAHEAVRDRLRDPESAVFYDDGANVFVDRGLICSGEVNARNGFGGMTGKQSYYYQRGKGAAVEDEGLEAWLDYSRLCVEALGEETGEIWRKLGKEPPPVEGLAK